MERRPTQPFALEGESHAIALSAFCPYVYVRIDGRWVLALIGDAGGGGGEVEARAPDEWRPVPYRAARTGSEGLVLSGASGGVRITTTIAITGDVIAIRTVLESERSLGIGGLRSRFWFVPHGKPLSEYGRPRDAWAPRLRPGTDHVIDGDAVTIEHAGIGVILSSGRGTTPPGPLRPTLDLDLRDRHRDAPALGFGLESRTHDARGLQVRTPETTLRLAAGGRAEYACEIRIFESLQTGDAWRRALRLLWDRRVPSGPDAGRPWAAHARDVYPDALARAWRRVRGGRHGGGGFGDGAVIPFRAAANSLRTAWGLAWWGRRLANAEWYAAAERVRRLALGVLTDRPGCLPSAVDVESGEGVPENGDYVLADMATTAFWMLRWHTGLSGSRSLLHRAREVGELLSIRQLPSGAIPAFFRADDLTTGDDLRESADTAAGVLLLAALARVLPAGPFLRAAVRGAGFLLREVVPGRRYDGSETAANEGSGGEDRHTGMHPQGTLAICWTAEALRLLFDQTDEPRFLAGGLKALDDLAGFQVTRGDGSVGSFGAGNASMANDARGSLFAETFLHYHRITGDPEWLERAGAALRAGFAVSGAAGKDAPFDAFGGAALAGAAAVGDRFGSLWIDVARRRSAGLDALDVDAVESAPGCLAFDVTNPAGDERTIEVVVDRFAKEPVLHWSAGSIEEAPVGEGKRASIRLAASGRGRLEIGIGAPDEGSERPDDGDAVVLH